MIATNSINGNKTAAIEARTAIVWVPVRLKVSKSGGGGVVSRGVVCRFSVVAGVMPLNLPASNHVTLER